MLFEGTYFYVHENCATWSADTISGVDLAVRASVNQKCSYCKHFGASVKCKESGRMYHFPCAAASGSFMHKPTMTLVGTDSLSKVSAFGK